MLGREPEIEDWLARRRALGQDRRDEVWEGVYHVAPHEHARNGIAAMALVELLPRPAKAAGLLAGGSFDLGSPEDFRVPDLGYHRGPVDELHVPSAALVVEVLSPDDETFRKFDFYARHRVDELWAVDPVARTIRCWSRQGEAYDEVAQSALLGLGLREVTEELARRLPAAPPPTD